MYSVRGRNLLSDVDYNSRPRELSVDQYQCFDDPVSGYQSGFYICTRDQNVDYLIYVYIYIYIYILLLSVVYSMYIIIKLLSSYYYFLPAREKGST